jgi:hypothetical protein
MKTKCPHLIKRRVDKTLPPYPVCAYQDLKTWADGLVHESVVERRYNNGEYITYDRHTMLADVLANLFSPSVQPLIQAGIRIDLGVQVVRLLVSKVMSVWATSCGKIVMVCNPNTSEVTHTITDVQDVKLAYVLLPSGYSYIDTLTLRFSIDLLKSRLIKEVVPDAKM